MKKRLVALLMIFMLTLTLLSMVASASDPVSVFTLSKNPRESINFALGINQLTITNLPNNTAFKSIMVNIVNTNGRTQSDQIITRKSDGSASMSFSGLGDGIYYIELYFYISENQYSSYIFGDELRFELSNGNGTFKQSPAYEHNKKAYEAGRSDNEALAYYLTPTSTIQSSNPDIIKLANDITKGITDNYKKAQAIHDWVCINIWYDWDTVKSGKTSDIDALSVLKNRRANCFGYTNLTAALLQAEGIPVKRVAGYGRITEKTGEWTQKQLSGNEVNHFWNEAYADGRWIIIDTTWDSGNDYSDGKKIVSDGLYFSRYFDATLEGFSVDHVIKPYSESVITAT